MFPPRPAPALSWLRTVASGTAVGVTLALVPLASTPGKAQTTGDFPAPAPYPSEWDLRPPPPVPLPAGVHVRAPERQEILQLLRRGAFAVLEQRFAELKARVRSDIRWEDQLAGSYLAFHGPETDLWDRLNEWVETFGKTSATPLVARAWYCRARALEWDRERQTRPDDEDVVAARDAWYRLGIADARAAVDLEPTDLGAHLAVLGLFGLYTLSESDALALERGLARFPESYLLREEALGNMRPSWGGSHERMQAVIDEAQRHVDDNPRLAGLRGLVAVDEAEQLLGRGDYAGALGKLEEAEALGTGWKVHLGRARTWYAARDLVRALDAANQAVAANPTAWLALNHRSLILSTVVQVATLRQREGVLAEALAATDEALALQPASTGVLERRAWLADYRDECAASTLRCFSRAVLSDEDPGDVTDPESWWMRLLLFVFGIPLTLLLILVEGNQLYLLPLPLVAMLAIGWNYVEWRRHRYWTPTVIHVMAALSFLTIVAINVDWVRAGGRMWIQRYVVIVVCVMLPYLIYLTFGGPRHMARRGRIPERYLARPEKGAGTPEAPEQSPRPPPGS